MVATLPAGSLADDQEDLARAIAPIRAEVTGTAPFLVCTCFYNELMCLQSQSRPEA